MQELKTGSVLQGGKYRIVRKLGQGGFGITYEGQQAGLERPVAIKEFFMKDFCNREDHTSHVTIGSVGSRELVEEYQRKFVKEAQLIASMADVPHVIRIYDIFEENHTAYYVMEFVGGGSLKDLVKQQGRLPEQQALAYTRQLGIALSSLHERNILHLDIKPDNVLLNAQGEAVLIDFGVSKHYDEKGSQTSSTPLGLSKGYAPPEQYQQGGMNQFSAASDVYSLGATLSYLLTGQTPPEAHDIFEDGFPPCPSYVSAPLWAAIAQAMLPRRRERTQTVAAFLSALNGGSDETVMAGAAGGAAVGASVGAAGGAGGAAGGAVAMDGTATVIGQQAGAAGLGAGVAGGAGLGVSTVEGSETVYAGQQGYTGGYHENGRSRKGLWWTLAGLAAAAAAAALFLFVLPKGGSTGGDWDDDDDLEAEADSTVVLPPDSALDTSTRDDDDRRAQARERERQQQREREQQQQREREQQQQREREQQQQRERDEQQQQQAPAPRQENPGAGSQDNNQGGGGGFSFDRTGGQQNDNTVYESVEQMPTFPGGDAALSSFVDQNMRYPSVARSNRKQGRVTVSFIVERDGSLTDVKVIRSVDLSLDREAKRLVSSMPRWNPGRRNGVAVRVRTAVSINFQL